MEIIVSPYWNKTLKILIILNVFLVGFFFVVMQDNSIEGLVIMGGYVLLIALISTWVLYMMRRLLTKVVATDLFFQSFLLGKRQCSVDRNEKIYYIVFKAPEGVYSRQEFILISNHYFKCKFETKWYSKRILSSYDMKKQILIPYNNQTSMLFGLNDWENVQRG